MKIPTSLSRRTKTEAESVTNVNQHLTNRAGYALQQDSQNHIIEAIEDEDIESNYVTNGSYA